MAAIHEQATKKTLYQDVVCTSVAVTGMLSLQVLHPEERERKEKTRVLIDWQMPSIQRNPMVSQFPF